MRRLVFVWIWLASACTAAPEAPTRAEPLAAAGPTRVRRPAHRNPDVPNIPALPAGLGLASVPTTWPAFADVSTDAGIVAPHVAHLLHTAIGQAWGDFDGDGRLDLYVTGGMAASRLFLNTGLGTFAQVDAGDATLVARSTAGAAWGDYDNDGDDDLIVVTAGENHLLRNDDGVDLVDVTPQSGMSASDVSVSVAWGDYDLDGWLDLYVVNHGSDPDRLYRGHGDGTFSDLTSMLPGADAFRPGFAAAFTDVDHDGTIDLYVVNDHGFGNDLFRGTGRGGFEDIGVRSGAGIAIDGMGLAVGDYDGDLDLDFFMSDRWGSHLLASSRSQGHTGYEAVSHDAGVSFQDAISWGCEFLDFDNDGWPDLYLATQHAEPSRSNRLFRNLGDGTFQDVSEISGASDTGWSYGAVVADYDEDGRVDIVVGNRGSGYRLYRNLGTVGPDNHWVEIELVGDGPVNRNALGAKVWVIDTHGVARVGEVRSGSTFGGGSSMRLHFGLGAAEVSRIVVRWPDKTTAWIPPATDTLLTFHYGE